MQFIINIISIYFPNLLLFRVRAHARTHTHTHTHTPRCYVRHKAYTCGVCMCVCVQN